MPRIGIGRIRQLALGLIVLIGGAQTAHAQTMGIAPATVDRGQASHESAWQRLRAGFALGSGDRARVARFEKWLRTHPQFLQDVARRSQLYLPYILQQVELRGLPTELALLPAIESAYNPFAKSHANAVGLWQFIAHTGRRFGLKINAFTDERRDLIKSTEAALDYLTFLHAEFDGDWEKAISAYNVGERRIHREVRRNRRAGKSIALSKLRLPRETRRYVPQLLALRNLINSPDSFSVTLRPLATQVPYRTVTIDGALDFAVAADLAGVNLGTLRLLNAAHKRRATQAGVVHRLLLPHRAAHRLQVSLPTLDRQGRTLSEQHVVRAGESVSQLARQYQVSKEHIQLAPRDERRHRWLFVGETVTVALAAQPFRALLPDGVPLLATLRESLIDFGAG